MYRKVGWMVSVGLLFIMFLVPAISHGAVEEGVTTQGDFALWLVKEVGALSKLPPAATGQDAIDFLVSLGIVPEGGWDDDEPVTRELLLSLLGDEEDLSKLDFQELVDRLKTAVDQAISDRQLGVFKAGSQSASGAVPA